MGDPITGAERHVFGAASTYHEITCMPLETGIGALSHERQAQLHCTVIEQREGKAAADAMRAKLAAANAPPKAAPPSVATYHAAPMLRPAPAPTKED